MNLIDRIEKMMVTVCARRKQKLLQMRFFSYLFDFVCVQAYTIYQHVEPKGTKLYCKNSKRNLCISLVTSHCLKRKSKSLEVTSDNDVVGTYSNVDLLIENIGKRDIHCFFFTSYVKKKLINLRMCYL